MKTYFTSDYCEGAHPSIMQKLIETNLAQTIGYGEDEFCEEARSLIKDVCGLDENSYVQFLVGGTQTNATVISSILRPYQGVICAETGHINAHETGAIEHSGHKVLALPAIDGKINAAQIEDYVMAHFSDESHEHIVQPGMVYISFPTELGTIYSKAELTAISEVCHRFELPLYIDGARLGYGLMCEECDVNIKEIAQLADIFYIGGTKQGALFGEAVVMKDKELIKDFRYSIKQGGGMLAKGRLLGIQFAELFRDGLYFRLSENADNQAAKIRKAFADKGFKFLVASPTNQQFPILTNEQIQYFADDFAFEVWKIIDEQHTAVRFCTSWSTTDEQADRLVKAIKQL